MSENNNQADGVEVKAFGASVTLKGRDVLPILKFMSVWGAITYILVTFHYDHKEMSDTMRVLTYVISLPQEARDNLNLNVPDSLRERIAVKPLNK